MPLVGFGKINYSQKITYYSILLFSDIEPIILSKVAHYSQIILNWEHIVCSIKLRALQKINDAKFLI